MARIVTTLLMFLLLSGTNGIPTRHAWQAISSGSSITPPTEALDPINVPIDVPINVMTTQQIIDRLGVESRRREEQLRRYSVPSLYRVTAGDGKIRAEVNAVLHYQAPGKKEFTIVSENGSEAVRNRVLKPLMDIEVETAVGRSRHDGSISHSNYYFKLLGEEPINDHRCYIIEAIPKRSDKYLFRGKIWVHATEFSIVRIAGQPARSPSFWISRVEFIRNYQKIGDFWLPSHNESQTQVRFFGRNILTIDYGVYDIS